MPAKYRTRQRESIMEVLKNNSGRHLSAEEIENILAASGEQVGRTTIYRCLDSLVREGEAKRYYIRGKEASYQLSNSDCCRHYHFKCTACGELMHVECSDLDSVGAHILSRHGFAVDSAQTVFYGLCSACSGGTNA